MPFFLIFQNLIPWMPDNSQPIAYKFMFTNQLPTSAKCVYGVCALPVP